MGVVDEILDVATPDVERAVRWLLVQGAEIAAVEGPHGMGFARLELALGDVAIRVVRDRNQWMMDVHGIDQPWLQLDLIHQVLKNDDQWTPAPRGTVLPDQLPIGVDWLDELPRVLTWLHSTPDAVEQVERMGRRRAEQLFG